MADREKVLLNRECPGDVGRKYGIIWFPKYFSICKFVIYELLWSENLRTYQQYSSTDNHVTLDMFLPSGVPTVLEIKWEHALTGLKFHSAKNICMGRFLSFCAYRPLQFHKVINFKLMCIFNLTCKTCIMYIIYSLIIFWALLKVIYVLLENIPDFIFLLICEHWRC